MRCAWLVVVAACAAPPRAAVAPVSASAGDLVRAHEFAYGLGVPRDYTRAAQIYEQACAHESAAACRELATAFDSGLGVRRDVARARSLYAQACRRGDGIGCWEIALLERNLDAAAKLASDCSGAGAEVCDRSVAADVAANVTGRALAVCRRGGIYTCAALYQYQNSPEAGDLLRKACLARSGPACDVLTPPSRHELCDAGDHGACDEMLAMNDPSDDATPAHLACAALARRDWQRATAWSEVAVERGPRTGKHHLVHAVAVYERVLAETGDPTQVEGSKQLAELAHALELDPSLWRAHAAAARIYRGKGMSADARASEQQARASCGSDCAAPDDICGH